MKEAKQQIKCQVFWETIRLVMIWNSNLVSDPGLEIQVQVEVNIQASNQNRRVQDISRAILQVTKEQEWSPEPSGNNQKMQTKWLTKSMKNGIDLRIFLSLHKRKKLEIGWKSLTLQTLPII